MSRPGASPNDASLSALLYTFVHFCTLSADLYTFVHFLHKAHSSQISLDLNATSLPPRFLLDSFSDFEDQSRRIRGGNEEAMRRIRGKIDVRPTFSRRPSQLLEDTVTFFKKEAQVASKFVSSMVKCASLIVSLFHCWVSL